MLLDCYVPSRFRSRWKRNTTSRGNTEIISHQEALQNLHGNTVLTADNWTAAIDRNMRDYLARVLAESDLAPHNRKIQAPQSIPEVMRFDKLMDCNTNRVWLNKPKKRGKEIISRFKMVPNEIREADKLAFYSIRIQPLEERYQGYGPLPQECNAVVGGDDVEVEDEGYDEDESLFVREA